MMLSFINLRSILKFVATPAGIIVIAVVVIQLLYSRNNNLKSELDDLKSQIAFQETVKKALEDSLKVIADYSPIPDNIKIDVPIPVPRPIENGSILSQADSNITPYVKFDIKEQWERWYRDNCAGMIEFDTTQIWDNGKGARVQGRFYYGIGADQRNWLLVSPAGDWKIKQKREGFRGGMEWLVSTGGDISIGADITWRKWGPAGRIDILEFSQAKVWFGIKRNL